MDEKDFGSIVMNGLQPRIKQHVIMAKPTSLLQIEQSPAAMPMFVDTITPPHVLVMNQELQAMRHKCLSWQLLWIHHGQRQPRNARSLSSPVRDQDHKSAPRTSPENDHKTDYLKTKGNKIGTAHQKVSAGIVALSGAMAQISVQPAMANVMSVAEQDISHLFSDWDINNTPTQPNVHRNYTLPYRHDISYHFTSFWISLWSSKSSN